MTATQDHIEVEWQFDAQDLDPLRKWLAVANVPGYTVTPAKKKSMTDTYYDTADWRVYRGRFTCRVRSLRDGGAELTLKAFGGAREGMRSRREMNEHLPGDIHAAVASPSGPPSRALALVAGKRSLEALFTIDQERETFLLASASGPLGEISVDETRVRDSPGVLRRVEVEVDATLVDESRRFVDLLQALGGLTPGTASKFDAGLQAAGLRPAPPETTLGSSVVTGGLTAGETAFAIMRKHFGVFLANEPGTRLGEDIEALHDMRVAARRLRAAMSAFRAFVPPRTERFRLELGRIATALGEVRDLDVQLERAEEWQKEDPASAPALEAVVALLHDRRNAARGRMLAVLDQRRYDLLVERFAAFLRRGAPPSFAPGLVPIRDVAPGLLAKRYRRLRRMGDEITAASLPAEYHALRIDGKRLRYMLEFLAPVYGQQLGAFAGRVTALQDVLGLHQDAEVAIEMLHGMAATGGRRLPPETLLAMGAVAERYRVHAAELRGQFPSVYKPLKGAAWKQVQKALKP